ncbi:nucleoside/nucleotide kinase family protein [Asaia sp. W19]|uniref:nucleoside/nucleotide kinase family protein n=1 Tax=unclassified Asaia TaxID=2685023 RepID=UPI000F8F349D|nr:nucleoside/nucleotide kinase family protein [Asaia sp. W19]RUT24526.1 nucleoside/nucleotide kinase family protein [Asaia sp. W19]
MTPSPYAAARARIDSLLQRPGRVILGLVGAPGGGKSTLAARLATDYPGQALVVPMDGFHLANCELKRLDRAGRKGAPDTFDAPGFVSLLQRIRNQAQEIVYAPLFAREIEEPIAGAIPVLPERKLIIVEGNYLLCDGPWAPVRHYLDESWFVATDEVQRNAWLEARHVHFGRTIEEARHWIAVTDAPNAQIILQTRDKADWSYIPEPIPTAG